MGLMVKCFFLRYQKVSKNKFFYQSGLILLLLLLSLLLLLLLLLLLVFLGFFYLFLHILTKIGENLTREVLIYGFFAEDFDLLI